MAFRRTFVNVCNKDRASEGRKVRTEGGLGCLRGSVHPCKSGFGITLPHLSLSLFLHPALLFQATKPRTHISLSPIPLWDGEQKATFCSISKPRSLSLQGGLSDLASSSFLTRDISRTISSPSRPPPLFSSQRWPLPDSVRRLIWNRPLRSSSRLRPQAVPQKDLSSFSFSLSRAQPHFCCRGGVGSGGSG